FCAEIKNGIDVVQLLPYHRMGATKYLRLGKEYRLKNVEAPTAGFMEKQLELFLSYGLPAQIS
ncbi:MAG: pyruvate formate lyase 1-activating protein, partial [Crenarchaeota archaeon]|nr:pyruvate formate lyase 1-activating protein [Thermoproteota archaeon]